MLAIAIGFRDLTKYGTFQKMLAEPQEVKVTVLYCYFCSMSHFQIGLTIIFLP
jgi:hypothetical protein